MTHKYVISVARSDAEAESLLHFDVESHDDLMAIVERVRRLDIVPPDETASLAVGVKLFAESFLRHRREPPFTMLADTFPMFMQQLKNAPPLS